MIPVRLGQPQQRVIFVCDAFRQAGSGNHGKPGQDGTDLHLGHGGRKQVSEIVETRIGRTDR